MSAKKPAARKTIGRWPLGRTLALLVLASALVFAVVGGEYGTFDWLQLRSAERDERAAIAELERVVDSLARYARALETDPKLQERVAREQFGMIRDGELLFRVVEP